MRVRGLKLDSDKCIWCGSGSHPVRVRGLKLGLIITLNCIPPSHPVRVRGLKLICRPVNKGMYKVAPRAGAWVETA